MCSNFKVLHLRGKKRRCLHWGERQRDKEKMPALRGETERQREDACTEGRDRETKRRCLHWGERQRDKEKMPSVPALRGETERQREDASALRGETERQREDACTKGRDRETKRRCPQCLHQENFTALEIKTNKQTER
jgi:hypothetical protein